MTDPIANLIISLKNAQTVGKTSIVVPFTNLQFSILEALNKNGFVGELTKKGKKINKFIEVALIYTDGEPKITGVDRISKQSRRIYKQAKEIKAFKSGFGSEIYSTPKGILTGKEARTANVGGELLFNIW